MCSDKMQALLSFRLPGLRQWLSDGSSVGADPGTIPIKDLDRSVGRANIGQHVLNIAVREQALSTRHVRFSFVDSGEQRAI